MHTSHCECKRTIPFVSFLPFWILFTVMSDTIPLFNVIVYCYRLIRLIQFVTHITRYTMSPIIYYRPFISPFEEPIIKLRITTNFLQITSQINNSIKIPLKRIRRDHCGFNKNVPDIITGTISLVNVFLYVFL